MHNYVTFSVVFILNLDILIDRFQPVSSDNGADDPLLQKSSKVVTVDPLLQKSTEEVTVDPSLQKISDHLLLVYRNLQKHKDSPGRLYEEAMDAVEELARDAVRKKDLEIKLALETNQKLTYMSLIDITEAIMNFIQQCYPPWMPKKSPSKFELKDLYSVLLNVEHTRVLRLKQILIKNQIKESDFVLDLERFISMRNEKAHQALYSREKKRAYEELQKKMDSVSDQTILEFLIGDKPNLPASAVESITTTSPEMAPNAILSSVDGLRDDFRLVVVPDFAKDKDEITLTQAMEEFYTTFASDIKTSLSESNSNHKPKAIFVVNGLDDGYMLFENFKSAYALWGRRGKINIPDKYRNEVVLKNITTEAPLEGNMFLKIEAKVEILTEFKTKVQQGFNNIKPRCQESVVGAGHGQSPAIFCQCNSFQDTLNLYEYWKREFEARIKEKKITFHAVYGSAAIKKLPYVQ